MTRMKKRLLVLTSQRRKQRTTQRATHRTAHRKTLKIKATAAQTHFIQNKG